MSYNIWHLVNQFKSHGGKDFHFHLYNPLIQPGLPVVLRGTVRRLRPPNMRAGKPSIRIRWLRLTASGDHTPGFHLIR